MQPFTMSLQMRKSLATIIELIVGYNQRDLRGESPARFGWTGQAGRRLRNAIRSI